MASQTEILALLGISDCRCQISDLRCDEGARLKSADKPFGIANYRSQITDLRFVICDLRFRAERGTGPSAALGRVVPEEQPC